MNDLTYLRNAILSQNLFITSEGLTSLVMDLFPTSSQSILDYKPAPYKEQVKNFVQAAQQTASDDSITVTTSFSDESLQQGTIAYHPVFGVITASSYWRFSTKQFEKDLLAAESNPAISCHFIHINSPGGEAWYMDRISETLTSLSKPIVVLIECICGSAAYYIACHGNIILSLTASDRIGCIGTMVQVYDESKWLENIGLKVVIARATASDLKNHEVEKLKNGDSSVYIERFLNPQNDPFLQAVKDNRPLLKDAAPEEPALRGEIYLTAQAIEKGLVDSKATLTEAIRQAKELGDKHIAQKEIQRKAINYLS